MNLAELNAPDPNSHFHSLQARKGAMFEIGEFIEMADLLECKWVINELIDRVSTLTGCANHLEDAVADINRELA
jgi:hypothetical protein